MNEVKKNIIAGSLEENDIKATKDIGDSLEGGSHILFGLNKIMTIHSF